MKWVSHERVVSHEPWVSREVWVNQEPQISLSYGKMQSSDNGNPGSWNIVNIGCGMKTFTTKVHT